MPQHLSKSAMFKFLHHLRKNIKIEEIFEEKDLGQDLRSRVSVVEEAILAFLGRSLSQLITSNSLLNGLRAIRLNTLSTSQEGD